MRLNRAILVVGLGIFTASLVAGTPQWTQESGIRPAQLIADHANAAEAKGERVQATPELTARGKKIYEQLCASCHGIAGDGKGPVAAALNPKPRDFTSGEWEHGGSEQEIFDIITKGVAGTAMAPFGAQLSEKDRWGVVYYVKSFSKK